MTYYRVIVGFGEPQIRPVDIDDERSDKVHADKRWQSRVTPLKMITTDFDQGRQFAIDYHKRQIKTIYEQIQFHNDCIQYAETWRQQ